MKRLIILVLVIFLMLFFILSSCRASAEGIVPSVEIEEDEVADETAEEVSPEETGKDEELAEEEPEAVLDEESEEPEVEEDAGIDEAEAAGQTVLDFIQAVVSDTEYDYFSSSTVDMVGTEDEYRNGDKSDIYFIIKESHSSWENIEITGAAVVDNNAEVEIEGDRMAEGMKYEGDQVTFNLVKEEGIWKIDFSSW